jgi:MoaD family protein
MNPDARRIQVRGYLTFRELLGQQSVELNVPQPSVRDCLRLLADKIGEGFRDQVLASPEGELQPHVALLLNGQPYRQLPDGLDTVLQDGDELAFFPPIAGGSVSIYDEII